MISSLVLDATRPQLRVLASKSRFKTVFASRRWGKSTCAMLDNLKSFGKAQVERATAWWVAPTYRQAYKPFSLLLAALLPTGLVTSHSRHDMSMTLATNWDVSFRSAQQPDNLRGEGVKKLTVDEAAQIPDETWYECLRPTLADTDGEGFFISSAKGRRGWAYEMYRRGQSEEPGYSSWKFTAHDACFISRAELDDARRSMPRRAFEQEFMSAFLDGVGVVFENLRGRPRLTPANREPVGIGVDWAKKVDYTVFTAFGADSGAVLDVYRTQRISYPQQVQLLKDFVAKWRKRATQVAVCHDQTGVGEAIDDLISAAKFDVPVDGVVFTEREKKTLVEETVVDIEAGRFGFVEGAELDSVMEIMLKEFEDYTATVTKTGKITYGAPEGFHDDCVMSATLARKAARGLWRVRTQYAPRVTVLQ